MRIIVNIDVPDLNSAVTFYQAALGLELSRVIDGDVAEMHGATTVLYLLEKPAGPAIDENNNSVVRDYSRHWTPVHVDFVVDDLDAAVARALQGGAQQTSACMEWRGSRCISFADPFGHGFCLLQFSGEMYSSAP